MFCICDCSLSSVALFIIFLLAILKFYNNVTKGIYEGNERLEGKTVIITGASAGIGAECAKDIARRGARVVMLCRDMVKGERVRQEIIGYTGNKNVVIKQVDFSSLASVRKCANEILCEESHIDILLNNAGAAGLPLHQITPDGMELLMQTNHFGPFLFTNILLGKIKESPSARIVNVSSKMHIFAKLDINDLEQRNVTSEFVVYSNTKLTNNLFTISLADKLKSTGVTVNCLHPGLIRSEINRNKSSFRQLVQNFIVETFFKDSWEGAQTSIFLCVSPSVEKITGKYFSDCKECKPSKAALDYSLAEELWKISEKTVQLEDNEKHY